MILFILDFLNTYKTWKQLFDFIMVKMTLYLPLSVWLIYIRLVIKYHLSQISILNFINFDNFFVFWQLVTHNLFLRSVVQLIENILRSAYNICPQIVKLSCVLSASLYLTLHFRNCSLFSCININNILFVEQKVRLLGTIIITILLICIEMR